MASSYPIVSQIELNDPARRWLGKRREAYEIPKIKAHEVLVWRVGDRYIRDARQLRRSDDIVVDASSVSVVNVRPGTEVEVSFEIDSQDASEFTIKVTFVCSVRQPEVVVEDGQVTAADTLLAYLRGYQELFNVGLKYPTTAINDVRTEMAVQVKAYMALHPPIIPGIEIAPSATVQVQTPEQQARYEDIARAHRINVRQQDQEAELAARRQRSVLSRAEMINEAVAGNSLSALGLAAADGMSSAEYAERLRQAEELRLQREQAERLAGNTRSWAVEDRDALWDYEYRKERLAWQRAELEQERKDLQELRLRKHALEDRDAQWKHDDEREQLAWKHAETERARADKQEGIRRLLEAEEKYLEALAQAGHFDTHVEDIGAEMQRIRRMAVAGLDMDDKAELTDGNGQRPESAKREDNGNDN
jgi:hypothetical protein